MDLTCHGRWTQFEEVDRQREDERDINRMSLTREREREREVEIGGERGGEERDRGR